jgi:hypothetical protein
MEQVLQMQAVIAFQTPQINQPLQQGLDCSTVGQHNSIPTKAEQPSTNL